MNNNVQNPKFSYFITEQGDLVFYLNGVQVDLCLLFEKCSNGNDIKYMPVKPIVGRVSFNGNYVKDVFTKKKYKYCKVDNYFDDGKVVLNGSVNKSLYDIYVAASYINVYGKDIKKDFVEKYPDKKDNVDALILFYSQYVYDKIVETCISEIEHIKTRTKM